MRTRQALCQDRATQMNRTSQCPPRACNSPGVGSWAGEKLLEWGRAVMAPHSRDLPSSRLCRPRPPPVLTQTAEAAVWGRRRGSRTSGPPSLLAPPAKESLLPEGPAASVVFSRSNSYPRLPNSPTSSGQAQAPAPFPTSASSLPASLGCGVRSS